MIETIIGGVAFASIPLLAGWLLVTGLHRGVIRARGASYSREQQPIGFWILVAIYAGIILFWMTIVTAAIVTTLQIR